MYWIISPFRGLTGTSAIPSGKCFSTSPSTYGLPVRNTRAVGDILMMSFSERRILTRSGAGHSSRALRHKNVRWVDDRRPNIFTISGSHSSPSPMNFLCLRNSSVISLRIYSKLESLAHLSQNVPVALGSRNSRPPQYPLPTLLARRTKYLLLVN